MEFWFFIAGAIVGVLCNILVHSLLTAHGTLRIDHSNPEKDVYRFEIDNLEKLNTKSHVELEIDHHANLSQK